jgi:hypothetical protein
VSTSTPGRELYAYWRVASAHRNEAVAAMRRLQARWRARVPGLEARLLVREGADDARGVDAGPTWTLMEIYRHPDGLDPATQRALDADAGAVLQHLPAGPRHVEAFQAVRSAEAMEAARPPGSPPAGR